MLSDAYFERLMHQQAVSLELPDHTWRPCISKYNTLSCHEATHLELFTVVTQGAVRTCFVKVALLRIPRRNGRMTSFTTQ